MSNQADEGENPQMDHTGALRDPFDPRDEYYRPDPSLEVRPSVDLRIDHPEGDLPIYYQGATNSCTANASAAALWYEERLGRHAAEWGEKGPSRLFIYWLARSGTQEYLDKVEDKGSFMRNAMKGIKTQGVCPEDDCPFPGLELIDPRGMTPERLELKKAAVNRKPDSQAFDNALPHRVGKYKRLDADGPDEHQGVKPWDKDLSFEQKAAFGQYNLRMLRACLSEGYPVAFSFWYYLLDDAMFRTTDGKKILKNIWDEKENLETGPFPQHTWVDRLKDPFRPKRNGSYVRIGHSVLAVGYDDATQLILVRNSRGDTWGNNGYFYMPYAWISDFAATNDFWTIRSVEEHPDKAPVQWEEIHQEVVGKILAGEQA
ncbi:hypothetical protein H2200_007805 [Cladophialophora chaetospira]|uniref:Peptidase C1A papain C-terminal domain-containing protein n=1 Tax=Cladophialophora chaetospira TaxID=386627 RepID=A0AA38X6G3_9EURO|nr:hypothetical protein H2200_007805 [Cladophialophora chaetospira]